MWSHAQRLRRLQWQSPATIQAHMNTRLQALVAVASDVPYYRDLFRGAGIDPATIRSVEDLARVPLTSKADLRAGFPDRTTAHAVPSQRRRAMRTSGSTGLPFNFYWDRACADELFGTYLSCLEWAGTGLWDTHVAVAVPATFASNPDPPSRTRRWARRLAFGEQVIRLSAIDVTTREFVDVVGGLRDRGYFIRAYPSALAHLAARLVHEDRRLPRYPAVVITYGETLTETNAAHIAEVFRCRVVNNYTSWDIPLIAQTCPDNPRMLHVNSDRVVVRIVRPDGTPAPRGESGRVAVTDLGNHVMPFINYLLGDRAVDAGPCDCGRGWPALASVDGRDTEVIETPSGARVSGVMLGHYLTFVAGVVPYVWEYQAVQVAPSAVCLRIVPTARFSEEFARLLVGHLEKLLGGGVLTTVEVVDQIPTETSGKRLIIKPLARSA
jgi:phenylacetate-CoA ligase